METVRFSLKYTFSFLLCFIKMIPVVKLKCGNKIGAARWYQDGRNNKRIWSSNYSEIDTYLNISLFRINSKQGIHLLVQTNKARFKTVDCGQAAWYIQARLYYWAVLCHSVYLIMKWWNLTEELHIYTRHPINLLRLCNVQYPTRI